MTTVLSEHISEKSIKNADEKMAELLKKKKVKLVAGKKKKRRKEKKK